MAEATRRAPPYDEKEIEHYLVLCVYLVREKLGSFAFLEGRRQRLPCLLTDPGALNAAG